MSITVKVNRDALNNPTGLQIKDRGRTVNVEFTQSELQIKGRLTEQIRDIIKLFYPAPYKEIDKYGDPELVQADALVTGGAGGTTTVLYQIPRQKKLYILEAFLMTDRVAVAVPYSVLYLEDLVHGESLQLAFHNYTYIATEFWISIIPEINVGFSSSFEVRNFCSQNTRTRFGFIGVLKDS